MNTYPRSLALTGVQDSAPWAEHTDIQCDFVMVYGLHDLENRVNEWRKHGYEVHLMTGVSWGSYQDFLSGEFDGMPHTDEGQVNHKGEPIDHEGGIPYMVPSIAFARYLAEKLKHAIDLGINDIHLEEPEFWTAGGYSEAFKREWQIYYGEPWVNPRENAESAYRCGKLKQFLYTRMLDRLCGDLKDYAMTRYGRLLHFYVPTHSLINYAQWGIVSPESALLDLPCLDGYIAQVWTGTARTPNHYEGIRAERTFETAFLEYGIMQELVRGTSRRMWFLQDPVEDDPRHTWEDYRFNYYRTLTAALMHPGVSSYEVAPWPCRVFGFLYPKEGTDERVLIPEDYKTNLLTLMQTLRNMEQTDVYFENDAETVGLLLADSAMYQRQNYEGRRKGSLNLEFDPFYGLALPLLKHGLPVRPIQLDNLRRVPGYAEDYRVLVLSYEFMKPEHPDLHQALAQWVNEGGALIYIGDDSDGFHSIRHWWNSGSADYPTPAAHLTEALGLGRAPADGIYKIGKGVFAILHEDPIAIAHSADKAAAYRSLVRDAMAQIGISFVPHNDMILRRGPYTITSLLSESVSDSGKTLTGRYVNLYEESLPIVENPYLAPGSVGLYYDLSKVNGTASVILAAAARIEEEIETEDTFSFRATCTGNSTCVVRIASPRTPIFASAVGTDGSREISLTVDEDSGTYLLRFPNSTAGVSITVSYQKA